MNDLLSHGSECQSDEEFFGLLGLSLERAADRAAVVEKFAQQRPDLAGRVRELASLDGRLRDSKAPKQQLCPGDRLGDFRIVRLIAVGGMGEVYEAEQESLVVFQPHERGERRRRVAIKVIRQGQLSEEYQARFRREQAVLARLHQTHVVPVHTAGEQDGVAYFSMPYIQGAALNHVLDAAYDETKARHTTPTLGDMASKISRSVQPATDTPAQIPTDAIRAAKEACVSSLATLPRRLEESLLPVRSAAPSPRKSLGAQRVAMTINYFRSVAGALAEAAEAVQHAHDAGVVHRDLKPSNIMIDADGHCWIIDFGLAGAMPMRTTALQAHGDARRVAVNGDHSLSTSPGMLGTVPYLAPEQLSGHADARSDVYGLGATLYELCTWRPPFAPLDGETTRRIRSEQVRQPRELADLPADLAAICIRALAKSPERRYQTAMELAADLKRWLNHEPTVARPARAPRRLWLWSQRNPGWAASIGATLLVIFVATYSYIHVQQANIRAQDVKISEAKAREVLANLEREHSLAKRAGWFDSYRKDARQAADTIDKTVELRSLVATGLAGPDARLQRRFPVSASSVAIDGKRLLLGGLPGKPAQFWDGTEQPLAASKLLGEGPVGFSALGEPLQLVLEAEGRLVLWNVATNKQLREFKFPDAQLKVLLFELSADGRLVGAYGQSADGKRGLIAVWNRENGKLVLEQERLATALAFAPDGSLLAAGNEEGQIAAWRITDGKTVALDLSTDRAGITALAFGRDPRTIGDARPRWLVAAGDDSGNIVIWDLERGSPRSICHGSVHQIHSLEFSPDGVTLGSVGRGDVRLWDTTTGRSILDIFENNWLTDLAFSPDGLSIAVSSLPHFGNPVQTSLWKLEPSRGIQTFRGLGQPISTTVFSPNSRYVAAIAHDSRVGVWDRQTERLLHVFEMPKMSWVDNAALMFSPDSKRLVCSGSGDLQGQARMWDIESGKEVAAWKLAPGLNHFLAFPKNDEALLFHVETRPGDHLPDSSQHPRDFPRVGRLYDLRPGQPPQKRKFEITEFIWDIEFPHMPEDGRLIAIKGRFGEPGATKRRTKVFDTRSGTEIWSGEPETKEAWGLMMDREGKFLTDEGKSIIELPSGKFREIPPGGTTDGYRWSPEMPYLVDNRQIKLSLIPRGQTERVLDLDRDGRIACLRKQFSPDGSLFVWGNQDGSVNVCDIAEVRRRLTEIGLGW